MKTKVSSHDASLIFEIPPPGFDLSESCRYPCFPWTRLFHVLGSCISISGRPDIASFFLCVGVGIPLCGDLFSDTAEGFEAFPDNPEPLGIAPGAKKPFGADINKTEIPVSELEELVAPEKTLYPNESAIPGEKLRKTPEFLRAFMPSTPIIARSDEKTIFFGRGLSRREKDYVVALLKRKLVD